MVNLNPQYDIKDAVLSLYHSAARDPITSPAAFGVACSVICVHLGCHLSVAAHLLNSWLEVPAGTAHPVTPGGIDGTVKAP